MTPRLSRAPLVGRLAVALGLVGAGLLSWSRHEAPKLESLAGYNLVLINVDTLRADHLGCYGYRRMTSPFIDSLAVQGVQFTRARANSSYTRESVAALLSGRLPSRSGSVGWRAAPCADCKNLGELFVDAGYRTAFVSATTVLTDPLFTKGFQSVRQLTDQWGVSGLGAQLSAEAIELARAGAGQRFMMYLHYLDPHGPYDPPADLYQRLADRPFPSPVGLYSTVRPNLTTLRAEGFGPGDPRFEDMVVRYDAEIADTDRAIAQLFDGLARLGVLDHTLVIVTSDHGEEFLEHGFVEHAWTLYDEVLHVPLVLWAPRALAPRRVARPVSSVDVLPTLLRLLAIPNQRADLDGASLLDPTPGGASAPVFAELLISERNVVRVVIRNGWKYVAAQRWLTPEERPAAAHVEDELRKLAGGTPIDPWGPAVHEEVYDLVHDPGERRDVVGHQPDALRELRSVLGTYLTSCPHTRVPAGELPAEDRERLKALGYIQ